MGSPGRSTEANRGKSVSAVLISRSLCIDIVLEGCGEDLLLGYDSQIVRSCKDFFGSSRILSNASKSYV